MTREETRRRIQITAQSEVNSRRYWIALRERHMDTNNNDGIRRAIGHITSHTDRLSGMATLASELGFVFHVDEKGKVNVAARP